ncbi:peptidoglycan-binding domain-containing protein [Actinocorallia sp. B10E7]|uniref:peptidoglycan-binding domain-containing protein n=1 Tax=Actinocorallia sp. B10E7 TaxID=3153558 RepID=UPI00325E8588
MFKASFASAVSLVLALGLSAPAEAAGSPFADNAGKAVAKVDSGLKPSESDTLESRSVLDPKQKIKEDSATFRADGKVVVVLRAVGAVAPVSGDTVVGRAVQRKKVKRARAGTRKVLIYTTGEKGNPGLTIAAWSERTGVNYQIVSRGPVSRGELLKLVEALPADGVQASRKARRAIRSAPPARRRSEPTQRSTNSLFVDGAGAPDDDLGDEANLCNGCSYSYSNYVWMWQRILMADAYLQGSLDCSFGSLTASSTRNWQSGHGLSADGIVGWNTRTKADNYITDMGGTTVRYTGLLQNVRFDRLTSNAYYYNSTRINYTNASLC